MNNLRALGVANMRTLEMKVSDSGPFPLRVNPHILTQVRNGLVENKRLTVVDKLWYHLPNEPAVRVTQRLQILRALYARTNDASLKLRLGQSLEIAIFRALEASGHDFAGAFLDLEKHDDSTLYSKEEPPLRFSGQAMPGEMRFDFLVFHPTAGRIGIEAKNLREWVYPARSEIKELLLKATATDTLPCLIARRVPFVTRALLGQCGLLVFENFNQLYPVADAALAVEVAAKENLGYHDVRASNTPNKYMTDFISTGMIAEAGEARARFDAHKDLLQAFATGELNYAAFAGRVKRRRNGLNEDTGQPLGVDFNPDDMEPGEPW